MKSLSAIILFSLFSTQVFSQQASTCSVATGSATLDINNINTQVNVNCLLWNNAEMSNPYHVSNIDIDVHPKTLFAGALWIGAIDDFENLRVAAQTYGQTGFEFWPGPIDNTTLEVSEASCSNFDRIWKINQSSIDEFLNGNELNSDQYQEIYNWPGRGNPHLDFQLPDQELAPFVDVNEDNVYNPDQGDYPSIKGDQACWWLANDLGNVHINTGSEPLGIEVQVMAFAYNSEPQFNSSTFYEYTIINKSVNQYSDMLFGKWVDFDLGHFANDLVGCDSTSALGYVYNDNFTSYDNGYEFEIPLQGIQFVDVPLNNTSSLNKMHAFVYYWNNPNEKQHYYNYLDATWLNGQHITYGGDGTDQSQLPSNYMFPSNPADSIGTNLWSQCSSNYLGSDKRIVMSTGKYDFAPWDKLTFLIAAHTILEADTLCPDIQPLIDLANETEVFFDEVVSVNENVLIDDGHINVFPIPAKNIIYFSSKIDIEQLEIFDLGGHLVFYEERLNLTSSIDVSELAVGNYVLEMKLENGNFSRKKISIIK